MLLNRLMILIMCASPLAACEQSNLVGQTEKGNALSSDSKDQPDDADEKVDPPNNISGTYLHCVTETEATDSKPEALVGCRFDDSTGKRVPATSLAADFSYTYKALSDPNIQVYPKRLQGDARYDAVYLFFGPDRSTLQTAIQKTLVLVQFKAGNGTGTDVLVGDQIGDIARDKNTLPEAPNNNYTQVRDEILIEAQQGQVTPPLP